MSAKNITAKEEILQFLETLRHKKYKNNKVVVIYGAKSRGMSSSRLKLGDLIKK